uniref:Uncharacterized protein n=1 Tax=Arundo donax TaxID=35708 RepID=A0A0A9AZN4_ARUDO
MQLGGSSCWCSSNSKAAAAAASR